MTMEQRQNSEVAAPIPASQHAAPQRRGSRAGVIVALGALGIGLLGIGGLTATRVKEAMKRNEKVAVQRAEVQAAAQRKAPASAVRPRPAKWRARVELTGTLKPWRDADIGFETGGRLMRVYVATGDRVKQGQPLALLDGTRAIELVQIKEATLKAAQANLAMAEDQARRTESLIQSKSIPEAQAEQARQQLALAKANVQASEVDLRMARTGAGLHTISAPFDGVVTRAPTATGSVVGPGVPLVKIEDLSRFRLGATVAEEDAPLAKVGQSAVVRYRDRTVSGKVITAVPSLDPATRRAPLEIEVPSEPGTPLLAWSFVRATLAADTDEPVLTVPPTARRPGAQDEVVTVVDGKIKIVRVVFQAGEDGTWYVRRGLKDSDVVLLSPAGDLRDGDAVSGVEIAP